MEVHICGMYTFFSPNRGWSVKVQTMDFSNQFVNWFNWQKWSDVWYRTGQIDIFRQAKDVHLMSKPLALWHCCLHLSKVTLSADSITSIVSRTQESPLIINSPSLKPCFAENFQVKPISTQIHHSKSTKFGSNSGDFSINKKGVVVFILKIYIKSRQIHEFEQKV